MYFVELENSKNYTFFIKNTLFLIATENFMQNIQSFLRKCNFSRGKFFKQMPLLVGELQNKSCFVFYCFTTST